MMMAPPQGKDSEGVADKVIELLWPYRKNALTITTDNGDEFVSHPTIAKKVEHYGLHRRQLCLLAEGSD